MGTRNWHLSRAKHHKEVADHLHREGFDDWAAVALAYAAHQWVHSVLSGEPGLRKDERHPRKHVSPPGAAHGGRGTNQLVDALFPDDEAIAYASLFEAGRRTRYDIVKLGDNGYMLLEMQFRQLKKYCEHVNAGRPDRRAEEP
ncbi:hypothetical protein [Phycicoccus jejuensis]|uniref:hypothetical protein n=1 Tax=Phycicoccus jejuensis TaxID=367299 RepID=UPI0004C3E62A|nr:hypothetical protein [Phycicoccus jejuensis]